jgi:hypothetical protein
MADKTPKWLVEWNKLVGDHKFIEIKGWYRWQQKSYTTDYIRDYYGKDDDPDYYTKTLRQRWVMDWLRRQRGRMRHTLPANPLALIQRMNAPILEARWLGLDLVLLVSCGFLIPTNEQVRDEKFVNKTKLDEIKAKELSLAESSDEAEEPEHKPTGETPYPRVADSDIELLNIHPSSVHYESLSDSDKEIHGLCFKLSENSGVAVKPTWVPFAREIVAAHGAQLCWAVLDWIFLTQINDAKFRWADRTKNMKNFRDHMMKGTVIDQYNAFVDKRERDAGKKANRARKSDSGSSGTGEGCTKNPNGGLNHEEHHLTVSEAFQEIEDD